MAQQTVILRLCLAAAILSATVSAQEAESLQFVTISRALGCPVTLYFYDNQQGIGINEAYLSPAFCAVPSGLTELCPQTDRVSNATYLNVPVTITDSNLLEAAVKFLRPLLGRRRLEFLHPLSVQQMFEGWALPLKLIRQPGKESTVIRVPCRTLDCSDIRSELASGVLTTFDRTELIVELSFRDNAPFNLQGRIYLSNHSRPLTPMSSKFVVPPRRYNTLRPYMTVAVDASCSANVLRPTSSPTRILIEPLLCYHGSYDYYNLGAGGGLVRVTLVTMSELARDRVRQEMNKDSGRKREWTITFMTILEAELRVSKWMSQWSFESLSLDSDNSKVYIRVRCNNDTSCLQFISILQSSSGDLWQHLSFSVRSQYEYTGIWIHSSTPLVSNINSSTCSADSRSGRVSSILTAYKAIIGSLCIRAQFVKQLPLLTGIEACADQCNGNAKCQAFSTAGGVCRLFLFDKCSRDVRDCNCNRLGPVFVKRQPGLEPGTLCPPGYGDGLCGVKYRVFTGVRDWKSGRSRCESDRGLVTMADAANVPEMTHIRSVYQRHNISSVWLGGYQTPGSAEPAGGWRWVGCNTPVSASLWYRTEPNNNGNENAIELGLWYPMLNDAAETEKKIAGALCKCVSPFD